MEHVVACPHCQQQLAVQAGQQSACPYCGATVAVAPPPRVSEVAQPGSSPKRKKKSPPGIPGYARAILWLVAAAAVPLCLGGLFVIGIMVGYFLNPEHRRDDFAETPYASEEDAASFSLDSGSPSKSPSSSSTAAEPTDSESALPAQSDEKNPQMRVGQPVPLSQVKIWRGERIDLRFKRFDNELWQQPDYEGYAVRVRIPLPAETGADPNREYVFLISNGQVREIVPLENYAGPDLDPRKPRQ